ncbi:MAG: CBS domain-containing protein [Methyloligellaceae bacterium]
MLVAEILEDKGDRVVSTPPDTKVSEIARTLRQEGIGAALVTGADGKLLGIISERDVVHGIAEHGPPTLEMSVSDLMTSTVITCTPETKTEELMEQMLSARVRHLPVVQNGKLQGIVSIGDVVKNVVSELGWIKDALEQQVVKSAAWATDED